MPEVKPFLKIPFQNIADISARAQYEIRRNFEELARSISPGVASFDAIIDSELSASVAAAHTYKCLTDLALGETWGTTKALNVGVISRATVITETGTPDISARGDLNLIGIGSPFADGTTTPNWNWVTPIEHTGQSILMRGLNINPVSPGQLICSASGGRLTAFDCILQNLVGCGSQTFAAWNCIIQNTAILVTQLGGQATLYNCDWNTSGGVMLGQTLHMIGGRLNFGGGAITFQGSGEIVAEIGCNLTVNTVTTNDVIIDNTAGTGGILVITSTAHATLVEGDWASVTFSSAAAGARSFSGKVTGFIDITGPAQITAAIDHIGGGLFATPSATMRGAGIQADLELRVGGNTGTLVLVGCTESNINASFNPPPSAGALAYTIDAASARCVLVTAGTTHANYSVPSTNAGTNCLVITELGSSSGAWGTGGGAGATGQQGPPGYDGTDGDEGFPGSTGQPGAAGAAGAQGRPGDDGMPGEDGFPGSTGSTGPTGAQGIQGPVGLLGPQGEDGMPGEDGFPMGPINDPSNRNTAPWNSSWGAQGTKASTAASGTATAGGAIEILDAVLGNYTFTALAGRRYRVVYAGVIINGSVAADQYAFNVRDGGASVPTITSTLLYSKPGATPGVGTAGRLNADIFFTTTFTAGVHIIGVGTIRSAGTGVYTPVGARELYVEDLGPV